MNSLTHYCGSRVIVLSASVCILLATVTNQIVASNGLVKSKPSVELHASKTLITYGCPRGMHSHSGSCPPIYDVNVALTSITKDFNKQALYVYTVTRGRIVGSNVVWDLSEAAPGIYTATVEVRDNKKHRALSSVTVTIAMCGDCVHDGLPCPMFFVTCYDQVKAGTPITCKVTVHPGTKSSPITYEWSARSSNGKSLSESISGSGTSISIPTGGLAGQTVYATVELKGLDPTCNSAASGSTVVKP
jgi:hypothetical protein